MSWWLILLILVVPLVVALYPVVLDLRNKSRVEGEVIASGGLDPSIEVFKNHYAVTFTDEGVSKRKRCRVIKGDVVWLD